MRTCIDGSTSGLVERHVHAADVVDEVAHAIEPDHRVAVDLDARHVLHGADHALELGLASAAEAAEIGEQGVDRG